MSDESKDHLYDLLESVSDERSFLEFAQALSSDRRQADSQPLAVDGFQGEWANQSIAAFLDSARQWAIDSQFGVSPGPKPTNPWRLFALFLWAGRGYE